MGTFGKLTPQAWVNCLPQEAIFDLPAGLAPHGTIASVVLRLWYAPFDRRTQYTSHPAALDALTADNPPPARAFARAPSLKPPVYGQRCRDSVRVAGNTLAMNSKAAKMLAVLLA